MVANYITVSGVAIIMTLTLLMVSVLVIPVKSIRHPMKQKHKQGHSAAITKKRPNFMDGEMKSTQVTITLQIGNDAMNTRQQIADAIKKVASDVGEFKIV
jgi:hypothetical protein